MIGMTGGVAVDWQEPLSPPTVTTQVSEWRSLQRDSWVRPLLTGESVLGSTDKPYHLTNREQVIFQEALFASATIIQIGNGDVR